MFSAQPPQFSLPDPETLPSSDEQPPEIPPNLAGNETLCRNVTQHLTSAYWLPYEQGQMRLWPIWKRIDDAWRARTTPESLDFRDVLTKVRSESGAGVEDGVSAKAQNTSFHKQVDVIGKIGVQIAWDEGKPVRFVKPDSAYEHPLYNPTQQAADACNELLDQNIRDANVVLEYRKSWINFVKYGHGWAWTDFKMVKEDVDDIYVIGQDALQAQMQVSMLMQTRYQGQQPTISQRADGSLIASFKRKVVKEMTTSFKHINVEDVFIDQLIPCDDIEKQPCPFVREHITEMDLWENEYSADNNPFGWLNTEMALDENSDGHYALSQSDEGVLREKLKHRYDISDANGQNPKLTIRQKWTVYPKLGIDEATGEVDTGRGVECSECGGKGKVDQGIGDGTTAECEQCKGKGRRRIKPERYCVQLFGALRMKTVCLRIQKLPKGYKVPLLFAADIAEDTTAAIPMSKAEVALVDYDQLIRAENQFVDSKDLTIYRGWKVKSDSPANKIQDFNKRGLRIEFDTDPKEATRIESNTFDDTITLIPFIQRKEQALIQAFGATEQLLGMLASGRRSALEVGNAIDSSKNPIVVMNDSYNRQMMGRWADRVRQNVELWGDRDWILKKTGRTFFGNLQTFTAVGEEFVKKMNLTQNLRYLAEASNNNPMLQAVAVPLWNRIFKLLGVEDIQLPDGGVKKGQGDAIRIISNILGDGQLTPPSPDDPHELFVEIFSEALRSATTDPSDYWNRRTPQNIPLLAQRLQMQQQLLQQQQMEQMQAMMAQQAMQMGGQGPGPGGNQPSMPPAEMNGAGEAMQQAQY